MDVACTATYSPSPALALNRCLKKLNTKLFNPDLDRLHLCVHTVLTLEGIVFPPPRPKDLQSSSSRQRTPLSICPRMQFYSVRLTLTPPTSPMSGWSKGRMFTILSEYKSPCIHDPKTLDILFFCEMHNIINDFLIRATFNSVAYWKEWLRGAFK